jgi:hypothetical protein
MIISELVGQYFGTKFHGLRFPILIPRSLSAVSEAPATEEVGVETLWRGRFRYSDLKEAAPRTMGFGCG